MKNAKMIVLGALTLIVHAFGSFTQDNAACTEVVVTDANRSQTVQLNNNEMLVVQLSANISGGYQWYAVTTGSMKDISGSRDPSGGIEYMRAGYYQGVSYIGEPVTQVLRLIPTAKGQTQVKLQYKRSWETEVIKEYVYSVNAAAAFTAKYTPPATLTRDRALNIPEGVYTVPGLPKKCNWRDSGWVTVAKNQGQTGSCWAFGTTGVVEAKIWKTRPGTPEPDYSEQYLCDCNTYGMGAANGGYYPFPMWISGTFKTNNGPGAVLETDAPFLGTNTAQTCKLYSHQPERLEGWGYADGVADQPWPQKDHFSSIVQMKQALWEHGPLGITIGESNWGNVSATTIIEVDGKSREHIVCLVGWDDDNQCWIFKNSWGDWSDKGFGRIKYGISAFGDFVTYAVLQDRPVNNKTPVAAMSFPASAAVNTPVQFSSTGSTDPDGSIASFFWNFSIAGDSKGTATGASPSYTFTSPGRYKVELTIVDNGGFADGKVGYISVTSTNNTPYNGTATAIPGKIEAENYDVGGELCAYHDLVAGNLYGKYRQDDVDIESCTDAGSGYDIASLNIGEWLKYTINAAAGGVYDLNARLASPYTTAVSLKYYIDDVAVGTVKFPTTPGWQSFQTVSVKGINISKGKHVFKMESISTDATNDCGNMNWFEFVAVSTDISQQMSGTPDGMKLMASAINGNDVLVTYSIPRSGPVALRLYTSSGKLVRTLVNEHKLGGTYTCELTTGSTGKSVSNVYFLSIEAGGYKKIEKSIMIK